MISYDVKTIYKYDEVNSLSDDDLDLYYECHSSTIDVYTYPNCDLDTVGKLLNDIYINIRNAGSKGLVSVEVVRHV